MWIETISDFVFSAGIIVLVAAATQTLAHVYSNQITLRVLLLAGTILYLIYYFVAADEPLWAAIIGTSCIGATSVYGLARALIHRSILIVPKDQRAIYHAMGDIEPGAFRSLMRNAWIKTFDRPERLTTQGEVPEEVFYTLEGAVDVDKNGVVFSGEPHSFIGEISIIGGFPASASVQARAGAKMVVWNRARLVRQMARDDKFRIAVEALFSKDMATKLAQAAKVGP